MGFDSLKLLDDFSCLDNHRKQSPIRANKTKRVTFKYRGTESFKRLTSLSPKKN